MLQDLRYALRMMARNPGFTAVAVFALALGIGANTAMFSVVDAVLLRPLAYDEPDRLVMVWETNFTNAVTRSQVSPVTYTEWRDNSGLFEEVAGWWYPQLNLTDAQGDPERARAIDVTDRFFAVLGADALVGRTFLPGEDQPQAESVVVIGHALWQRRFGGDASALAEVVRLDGVPHAIVGVMPPGFDYPNETEVWRGLSWDPSQHSREARFFEVVGRLRPGLDRVQAQADLDALAVRLATDYPDSNRGWGALLVPLHEQLVGDMRPALLVLFGAVGFVLLIACANVANLLLARASVREKEIAIRLAVGASRGRLVRQLLTESLVLAFVSAVAGTLLAWVAVRGFAAANPIDIPRLGGVVLDARLLLFTFTVASVTAVLFGLVPALQASRSNVGAAVKDGARESGASAGSRRVRTLLVVSEVAIALMLLVGAALLLKSFGRLQEVDPGVRPTNVLSVNLQLSSAAYPEWASVSDFYTRLVERVETIPGVRSAATTAFLVLEQGWPVDTVVDGQIAGEPGTEPKLQYHQVSPRYFETVGVPLLSGRAFTDRDDEDAPGVAILNQAAVRRLFPTEDPLGRRIVRVADGIGPLGRNLLEGREVEVVGVVADAKNTSLTTDVEPALFLPQRQFAYRSMHLVVRGEGPPLGLVGPIRETVRGLDLAVPLADIKTLDQHLGAQLAQPRFSMVLLSIFAALALVLASVGLYAVMAYSVSRRRRELGVRLALGAQRGQILGLVVRQGMVLALSGVAAGLVGSFVTSQLLQGLLYGVSPTDIVAFGGVTAVLLSVALVASYVPASRATAVDPVTALRAD